MTRVLQDPMQLIPAFQQGRKFWLEPKTPSLAERQQWLSKISEIWGAKLDALSSGEVAAMASEAGVGAELFLEWDLKGSKLYLDRQIALAELESTEALEHLSRGVLTLVQSQLHPIRLILERLIPGLFAGNSLVINFSFTPLAAKFLAEVLDAAEIPAPVVKIIVGNSPELLQILQTHPAVAGVSQVGEIRDVEESLSRSQSLKRVFQAWTGGRTSLLALENLSDEDWRRELRHLFDGSQLARPYDVSRVFVLEAQEADAKAQLTKLVSEAPWIEGFTEAEGRAFEAKLQSLKQEEGRLLCGGEVEFQSGRARIKACLIQHLPQCSEYHQEDPIYPILLLSSVKYAFDAAKWVNNASRGFAVQIHGPAEKIEKLAPKFEVGRVLGPKGYDVSRSLLFGLKESAVGITDLRAKGLFFSQERLVDSTALE